MITIHCADALSALDPDDGLPIWAVAAGAELVPGVHVVERLGVGYRCETWLGWLADQRRSIVVKVARPHQVNHVRARVTLGREVRALEGNRHPGLPRLHADGTTAPIPYVIMEHIDGSDLDEAVGPFRLGPSSVTRLGLGLLAALAPLHARGLAHLDLKPENVILAAGRVVLIDFGSSRTLGSPQPPGRPVGTLGWAPPEMEACEPIAAAMDLYGVGRVLRFSLRPPNALVRVLAPRRTALDQIIDALLRDDPADRPDLAAATRGLADLRR